MDAPSAAEVKERSPLLAAAFPDDGDVEGLERLIDVAAPLVGALTGRTIAGTEGEDVPEGMLELAKQAIALKTQGLYTAMGTAENAEEAIERSNLRSIAAGSWSESYWGPAEAMQAKVLDLDPLLASLLWALCTWEKQDEWLLLWDPEHAPGFSVIEAFDYRRRPGGY